MRIVDSDTELEPNSSNRKFDWHKLSFKKWLISRKQEKSKKKKVMSRWHTYHVGRQADQEEYTTTSSSTTTSTMDSDQLMEEQLGIWAGLESGDRHRRYSCAAPSAAAASANFQLLRSLSTGSQEVQWPRQSSAAGASYGDHDSSSCDSLDSKYFTDIQNFRVFVGTWNVGGRPPGDKPDILEEWLGSLKEPADIYVIGFQEVVPLSAGNVLGAENNAPAARWQQLIQQTLNNMGTTTTCTYCSDRLLQMNGSYKCCVFDESTRPDSSVTSFNQEDQSQSTTGGNNLYSVSKPCSSSTMGLSTSRPCAVPISPAAGLNCNHDRIMPGCGSMENVGRSHYTMIASKQMVGLYVSVWVKSCLRQSVREVKVSCIGCGLMGYLGNKGSISVSMCIHQTTFCFVCSHLASGQKDGDEIRRNADVAEILRRTQFRRSHGIQHDQPTGHGPVLPESILEHDRVIWLGDLNYRLALSPSLTRSLLAREDWEALLEKDQLQIQRDAGRVFSGWHEGRIYFAPTYKYRANSDSYTLGKAGTTKLINIGDKKRTPAWCDRILWYGSGLKQLAYVRAETKFSDHRPVYAVFSAQVDVLICGHRGAQGNDGHGHGDGDGEQKKLLRSDCLQEDCMATDDEDMRFLIYQE